MVSARSAVRPVAGCLHSGNQLYLPMSSDWWSLCPWLPRVKNVENVWLLKNRQTEMWCSVSDQKSKVYVEWITGRRPEAVLVCASESFHRKMKGGGRVDSIWTESNNWHQRSLVKTNLGSWGTNFNGEVILWPIKLATVQMHYFSSLSPT